MTRDEVGTLLTILRATYHTARLDNLPATVEAWHMALADAPFGLMQQAARAWMATEKWFPTPAELRMVAIDQAGLLPTGAEAWGMVLRHMRATSGRDGEGFDGPAVVGETVRDLGGWRVLRTSEEPARDRAAFLRAYETRRMRAAREMNLSALVAIVDEAAPSIAEGSASCR